jgi:putative ABC transport system permease protein
VGRLKKGATIKQAEADIETITANIKKTYPDYSQYLHAYVLPMRDQFADTVSKSLIVLLVAVGCVLLVACANIANLLLARAAARQKEIAVRTALGANRGRIVRQLLTESLVMAGAGGILGIVLAQFSFVFLKKLVPSDMTAFTSVKIDPKVFAFTLGLSLITGIAFGLAPALYSSRLDLNDALKQAGGRGATGGHNWLRNTLVIAEVALSLVLLIGAGLMIKTIINLNGVYSGFSAEKVLTLRTDLPAKKYADLRKRAAFYQQVIDRVRTLPGIVSVGYTTSVPLVWRGGTNGFEIEGKVPLPGMDANHRQISSDYFKTMSIPIRAGRTFNEYDGPDSQPVAMINETMARQFWSNENALGTRFRLSDESPWITVVGIAGDVNQMGLDVPVKAEMYFPYQQDSEAWCAPRHLVVRTTGNPKGLAAIVTQSVWSVDKDQPVSDIKTMQEILDEEVSPRSTQMWLMTSFAVLALLLASVGIYGVLSFAVAQRIPEIGVRMALGAQQTDVLKMIVGQGMILTISGVGIGLVAAFLLTRLMSGLLFGVNASDPTTFAIVVGVLAVVSFVACLIPARRATKVDPMVALRYE